MKPDSTRESAAARRLPRFVLIPAAIALAGAALIVVWRDASDGAGEYVGKLPPEFTGSARSTHLWQGALYWLQYRGGSVAIRELRLGSGAITDISHQNRSAHAPGTPQFYDGHIYFARYSKASGSAYPGVLGAPSSTSLRNLGYFRSPSNRVLRPGEVRAVETSSRVPQEAVRVTSVSLSSGRKSEVKIAGNPLTLQGRPLAISGDAIYWVDDRRGERITITTSASFWNEEPNDLDLMATPLNGGSGRAVMKGVSRGTIFAAEGRAVYWESHRPYPDSTKDLGFFIISTGKAGTVQDHRFAISLEPRLLESAGRLYWIRENAARTDRELVEASPESRLPRIVLKMKDRGIVPVSNRPLRVVDGRLYIAYTRYGDQPQNGSDSGHGAIGTYVARIDPAGPSPLAERVGPILDFQGEWWLDQGHLYYLAARERRSLFDSFNSHYSGRFEYEIYRLPLPRSD